MSVEQLQQIALWSRLPGETVVVRLVPFVLGSAIFASVFVRDRLIDRFVPEVDSLRTAKITALFCALAAAMYAVAQVEPSPLVALFFAAGPLIAVILWLQRDAGHTRVGAVHDLGFLLWFSWPVVIPWYVWKTRGRSGWRLGFGLFALIGSAYLSWLLVAWLIYAVQYFAWYSRAG